MKILVVEDDPAIAQTLQLLLANYQYAVEIVSGCDAGLQQVETSGCDLIVLDLAQFQMEGVQLCQRLRARGLLQPILLLTAPGTPTQTAIALEAGANDYLVKPFSSEALNARIQTLLQAERTVRSRLTWASLTLDPTPCTVVYGTQSLSVTASEYAILELFLRHPQAILSAQAILEQVWRASDAPQLAAVRVQINKLRQKLTAVGAPPDLIQTKRGMGYQLNPSYASALNTPPFSDLSSGNPASQAALHAAEAKLQATLEQLQLTQATLQQKQQELERAYQTIAQTCQPLSPMRGEVEQQAGDHPIAQPCERQSRLEQQWQALFEHALDAIAIADDAGNYVDANPAACALFGVSKAELLRSGVANFADPTVDIAAIWQRFLQVGQMSGEFRLYRPDGTIRDAEFNAIANFIPGRHLSILRDISDRKQAEIALRASEAEFRGMFNLSGAGMAQADPQTRRLLRVNAAFCAITGYTEAELLTLTVDDLNHPDERGLDQAQYHGLLQGDGYQLEKRYRRKDGSTVWVLATGNVIRDAAGQPIRAFAMVQDISERKRLEAEREQAQRNLAFLAQISQDLADWSSITATLQKVSAKIGAFFNLERCYVAEIDDRADTAIVSYDWYPPGLSSLASNQVYRLSDFLTPEFYQVAHAGEILVISDTHTDPRTIAESFAALNIRSAVSSPFMQEGQLRFLLCCNNSTPRAWRADEIELLRELTTRIWIRLERAYAEAALWESEERQTFLLQLSDRLRTLTDAEAIQFAAATALGEYLGADRVGYAEDQGDGETIVVARNYTKDVPSIEGCYHYDDYGPELLRALRAGQTVVRHDIAADPTLTDAEKAAHAVLQLGATVNVPLLKAGCLVAVVFMHYREAHHWSDGEIALLEEVTVRTWDAVIRARTEVALRRSEAKYRLLFDEMDEGYCIAEILLNDQGEPVDYRILEANPQFEHLTALPRAVALSGRTIREIAPELEEHWYQIYGQVALTGEPVRFEQHAEEWGRWYDVYAFRIGEPENRHVAILFNVITDRKRREANLQFLTELAEAFSHPAPPDEMMQMVGTKVGAHLRITNCLFGEIDVTQNQAVIVYNWHTPETPDATGVYSLSDFVSPAFLQAAQAGEVLVVENTQTDPRTDGDRYATLQAAAFVAVPFLQNNTWKYVFAVHDAVPRQWRKDEIELISKVTNRTFPRLERARAEEALRKNEQLLRLALAGAQAGSWIWEITAGQISWSPEMYPLYGLEPTAEVPHYEEWCDRFVHPDDRDWLKQQDRQIIEQKQSNVQLEFRIVHPQKGIRWILTLAHLSLNEQGEPVQLSGINLDISDRKQLELSLLASETKLSRILDNAVAAISEFRVYPDRSYVNEFMSAGCEMVYGYAQAAMSANPNLWVTRILPEDAEHILDSAFDQIFTENTITVEYRFQDQTGNLRWISETLMSRWDETAACWNVTSVAINITDRKQAEIALQQQIRQEHLLKDMAQDIRRSLSLDDVLARTVDRVRDVLQTDRVVIFRFDANGQGEVIKESVAPGWQPLWGTTITDTCFGDRYIAPYQQGRVTTITNVETDPLEPCYAELLQSFQVKANLVVPVLQGEKVWGLLIAHHCSAPRQWRPTEIELLQQLATHVEIAIQQSELYEQTRRELAAREQMQIVLEESEARFRSLNAAAPIAICQTNTDGLCLYNNARWQEMSGLSFEESLGTGWLVAVHPDDRESLFKAWNRYLEDHQEFFHEYRLLSPQGIIRWIATRAAAMRSPTGEIIGYVSIGEDITDRKQTEQALRTSEQRLRTILDNSPTAIYLLDPQNNFLLANRVCAELNASTPEALVGRNIAEFWPPDVAATFAANNRIVLETGQLLQTEEVAPHSDGLQHTYISVKFPLCDTAGIPYAICGISTDITDKKQLEAQFYRAQRLESLGTLASGIAHDLNNVLTPILAMSQLLRLSEAKLDARSQEMLSLIESSAKRGVNMVKQILTFTRGTEGERHPIQIASLLQEVIRVVQQSFPKAIAIRATIPDFWPWLVSADATYLHQVFMNLCVNARDAMPDGGTLSLALGRRFVDQAFAQANLNVQVGDYVVVTITDTGIGIPLDVRDRIFEPFFTTKPLGQGTGLGLATVLGIVKNYGGFLQVFSEVGEGTAIKVFLPIIEAGTPSHLNQPEDPLSGNGELILVVDDDEAVQRTTQSLLESHHYTTLLADDGLGAIALYAQHRHKIKLVILDIMMPTMSGIVLIQRLKAINPLVKIIAISGLSSNREPALDAGADTFLSKPYTLENLLKTLQTVLKA